MSQPCKAILIDAFARTVTEVDYTGDFHQIYKLIDCHTFDVARINDKGDGIYIDDDGLFKEHQKFFLYEGYPQPLAGRGLILGANDQGESVQPYVDLQQAIANVQFVFPIRLNGKVKWAPAIYEADIQQAMT